MLKHFHEYPGCIADTECVYYQSDTEIGTSFSKEHLHNAESVVVPLKVYSVNILAYILYIVTCCDIPRLHTT